MRSALCLGMLSLVTVVTGCIPLSLHPLYTEDSQTFEPNLVGAWLAADKGADTKEGWFFASEDQATYRLVIREDGEANPMDARLVRIGESLFLDVFPAEVELGDAAQPGLKLGDYYRMQLLALHSFVRVELDGDNLRIRPAYYKALEQIINETPEVIAHQPMPGDSDWFFFTAPPEAMQAFVAQYEKKLFESEDSKPIDLKRWAPSTE